MSNGFSHLVSAELTDVGRRRQNNEDAVLRLPAQGVFCVADGMGGVRGGEMASKAVVDALRQTFTDSPDAPYAVTATSSARLVARALNRASQWIKAYADEHGLTGAGSTVLVLAFDRADPSKAIVLHAGDSRAYRLRADTLVQLSADHSVAAAAGLADEKDLPAIFRGVITRAVGLDNTVRLEETPADVRAGDLFLLCSDGLNKMVSDRQLQTLLHRHCGDDPQTLAKLLVGQALEAGGEDNISVVLVRVGRTLPPAPTLALPPQTLALEVCDDRPDAPSEASGLTVAATDRSGARQPSTAATQTIAIPPAGEAATAPSATSRRVLILFAVLLFATAVAISLLIIQQRAAVAPPGAAARSARPARHD